jgi:hypothetical protein
MSLTRPAVRLSHVIAAAVLPFLGIVTCPAVAGAQGVDEFGAYGPPPDRAARQSSQNFTLELRMGPYLPDVDAEFPSGDAGGPFTRYFGRKRRVAVGLELDWLPLTVRDVLRFGPAAGVMYTTFGGKPFFEDNDGEATSETATGQTTSLRTFPHWIGGVLRIDALARMTPIPLVFAGKAGLAHALWWTDDMPKDSPAADGTKGRGRSYGSYFGVGTYLDFGFLDDMSRKRLDAFLGINRLYIFGELYWLQLDGFGANKVMNLSDQSWVLGLALDI